MKVSGKILPFILILSGFSGPRCGATVYHSNGTAASVQSIHNNQAQNGDTITIPAGTFTWTTGVKLTKAITLQGQGVGSTIIKDDIQNGAYLLIWDLPANLLSRITGIQFQDGGRTPVASAPGGWFHVNGSNVNGSQFRMDHCEFDNLNGAMVFNTVIGVIDHTTFTANGGDDAICIYGERWNGAPPGSFGDASWAAPNDFGSSQFTFFEDCVFQNNNAVYRALIFDCYEGGRFVVRHSTVHNCTIGTHGTESSGRQRGSKAIEVYNNTFTGTKITSVIGNTRSAQLVYHDNTISGYEPGPYITLAAVRYVYACAPWGQADGLNQWDTNSPTIYFTGTAAAPSSGTTVTVSGASWTRNQWAGYTIRRTSDLANSHTANASWIWSNTANTITYSDQVFGGPPGNMTFAAGDTLNLRKVVHALDEPGWTGGSLISGNPPVRPATWNDQVAAPSYQWNNGALTFTTSRGSQAAAFRDNPPMPGYTPYVYPHPLVTGAARAVADFNGDGSPDYLVYNSSTQQTVIGYLDNNVLIGSASGPTVPVGWSVVRVADFNGDGHPDYLLFNPTTRDTVIWYMNNNVHVTGNYSPTLPVGWSVAAVADFNGDGHPDYLLFNPTTRATAIWYMNVNVHTSGNSGPTLPVGWSVAGAADFNHDGKPDYVLYNSDTCQTAIWYLNNNVFVSSAAGPTLPPGWSLTGP